MPTSMCRAADAAGTASPAARTSTAPMTPIRPRNGRPPPRRPEQPLETLLQLDLGLPCEQLARARDVRLSYLRIVDGERLVDDLALRAGQAQHRLRELVQRELVRIAQ